MKKNKIEGCLIILMVFSAVATVRALVFFEPGNKILYMAELLTAIVTLFSTPCILGFVLTILWQMTLPYLVTWLGFAVICTSYWYLFSHKKKQEISMEIPKEDGTIFKCCLRTSFGVPIPWKHVEIDRSSGELKIYLTSIFSRNNNAQSLYNLCDAEKEGSFFPYVFFGTSIVSLKMHEDKKHVIWKKFVVSNKTAEFLAGRPDSTKNKNKGFLNALIIQAQIEARKRGFVQPH